VWLDSYIEVPPDRAGRDLSPAAPVLLEGALD
jgi:hypothetical protein